MGNFYFKKQIKFIFLVLQGVLPIHAVNTSFYTNNSALQMIANYTHGYLSIQNPCNYTLYKSNFIFKPPFRYEKQ